MKAAAEKINRVLTLDLLRGYFLLVIVLNHLHYYPSGLEWITGQSYLYASTAEGFFLISGIVLGIVRGAKLLEKPFKFAASLLLKRSLQLYVTSIILVLIFTFIGWLFVGDPGLKYGIFEPAALSSIPEVIWKTITFQYLYGWTDYLRLYAIFIFFSPIALWLLRKGQWAVVLLISTLVWALYSYTPLPAGEFAQPLSWQLIFFSGFVLGFYWKQLGAWWKARSVALRRVVVSLLATVTVITLVANVFIVFGYDLPGIGPQLQKYNELLSPFFNKDQLLPTRLALFAIWFTALYMLFARFEPFVRRFFGWLLIPFGTNSLYVYTIQAFVVFFVMIFFDQKSEYWFVNLAISLGVVGLVYLAVRTKFLMKIIPR